MSLCAEVAQIRKQWGLRALKATSIPMPRAAYSNAKALAEVRARHGDDAPVLVFVSPRREAVVIGAAGADEARASLVSEAVRSRVITDDEIPTSFPASSAAAERGDFAKDRDPSLMRWVPSDDPGRGQAAFVWRSDPEPRQRKRGGGSLPRNMDTSGARQDALGGSVLTLMTGRLSIALSRSQMTTSDVAVVSGVPQSELTAVIDGRTLPSRTQLTAIASAVGVSPSWLGGRESPSEAGVATPAFGERGTGIASPVPSIPTPVLQGLLDETCVDVSTSDVFDRLAMARSAARLSSKRLASRVCESSITVLNESDVESYEGGKRPLPVVLLREWSRACGVSWEWTLTGVVPLRVRLDRLAAARRQSRASTKAIATAVWGKPSWHRKVAVVELGEESLSESEQGKWLEVCGINPGALWVSDESWARTLAQI